jgi:protein-S-isoprenylcysteine O-methyltransferase Ste14
MDKRIIGWLLVATQVGVFVVLALLPWRSPSALSIALAIPFIVVGGWLGVTSFGTLGGALTPTPVPIAGAGLRTQGPYAWVRHPMYSALFLMGLGWLLLTANWFIGAPLMIGMIVVVFMRVENEEGVLIDLFGDEYREYMQRTGRFLPLLFAKG